MAQRHVDKVGGTQLLEATKGVLDHLSRWLIESGHGGGQDGLSQLYGQVRRLKDYLQRGVAAYPNRVVLDLSAADEELLAACAVHHLGEVETQLRTAPGNAQQRAWLESKVKGLAASAIQLATTRLSRIPVAAARGADPPAVREVLAAIARHAAEFDARLDAVESALAPCAGPLPRAAASADPVRRTDAPKAPRAAAAPAAPRSARVAPAAAPAESGALALRPDRDADTGEPGLLDTRAVRDPRLRAMIALDQKAFEHSKGAGHYRLSMVLLASILEGVVVDYAIPRRKELAISGTPETWRIDELVAQIMGDSMAVGDRPCLVQLSAARNLVRPAAQLTSPMAVTAASLQQNEVFVRRVLTQLGFTGSAS